MIYEIERIMLDCIYVYIYIYISQRCLNNVTALSICRILILQRPSSANCQQAQEWVVYCFNSHDCCKTLHVGRRGQIQTNPPTCTRGRGDRSAKHNKQSNGIGGRNKHALMTGMYLSLLPSSPNDPSTDIRPHEGQG